MKNIHNNKLELKNKVELLNNLSPTNTMLRGYSIIIKMIKSLQVHRI